MLSDGWLTLLIIVGILMAVVVLYYACLWWALRQDSSSTSLREPLTRTASINTNCTSVSIEV